MKKGKKTKIEKLCEERGKNGDCRPNKGFYEEFYENRDISTRDPIFRWVAQNIVLNLHLTNEPKGMLLDVGSGSGTILRLIADATKLKCMGIDISEIVIKKAHRNHHNLLLLVSDATHLPFKDNTFDYIVSNHNIEHIPDDDTAIHEMSRVLKNGGKLYLATPNAEYFFAFKHYREKNDKDAGHVRIYSKEVIIKKWEKEGFEITGFKYERHILHMFGYRYFLLLTVFPCSIYNRLIGRRSSVYGIKTYPADFMYKLLKFVYKIEDILFNSSTSHIAFYLVATKILEELSKK